MKSKLNWLEAALVVAPFIFLALFWNALPAKVPVHWGPNGEIDSLAHKFPGLLIAPLLGLGVAVLLRVLPWLDPKLARSAGETGRMPAVLPPLRFALLALFNTILLLQITVSLGKPIASGRIIISALLILLLILGNYLGNLRPNYFIGIRTPWTLEDAETWRATHRLGGRLIFFGALLLFVVQFLLEQRAFAWLFTGAVIALAIWGILYSWHHFRTHAALR